MKYLKMLAIAAMVAMALMAVVGANTASADVLCNVNTTSSCPSGNVVTSFESSLKAGTSFVLKTTASEELSSCTQSSVSGTVETQAKGIEPQGPISNLTWGNCNHTTDTIKAGRFKVETRISLNEKGEEVHTNTVTTSDTQVTFFLSGVTCTYGPGANPISLGDLTVGEPAIINVNTVVNRTAGNTFFCPPTARWSATYQVTKPAALWVSEE